MPFLRVSIPRKFLQSKLEIPGIDVDTYVCDNIGVGVDVDVDIDVDVDVDMDIDFDVDVLRN